MKISITARKFKAHDSLKDFINSEVAALDRYNDEIHHADVILSYQNNHESVKTCEIILHVPGQTLTAQEGSDDFKKSVASSVEKLAKQLDKIKTIKTKRAEKVIHDQD